MGAPSQLPSAIRPAIMKRIDVRKLKRKVALERDAEAMLALLERSVRFGHKRLALSRCLQAEQMGIAIRREILAYCKQVAMGFSADEIDCLLQQAAGPDAPATAA